MEHKTDPLTVDSCTNSVMSGARSSHHFEARRIRPFFLRLMHSSSGSVRRSSNPVEQEFRHADIDRKSYLALGGLQFDDQRVAVFGDKRFQRSGELRRNFHLQFSHSQNNVPGSEVNR